MARAAVLGRLTWQVATVVHVRVESATARTIVLDVPEWPGHLAGQHVDVRLTAEDGYSAQRSYSIASRAEPAERTDISRAEPAERPQPTGAEPAERPERNGPSRIELTVDRLPEGEVSSYLTDVLEVGDLIELRGPLGGWFVWRPEDPRPVLLVGGGSGVVPLAAMLRTRAAAGVSTPFRLVYSIRSPVEEIYADDPALAAPGVDVHRIYTRKPPGNHERPPGRITAADLDVAGWHGAQVFVCGPSGFVEAAATHLLALGHRAGDIKTERFGPTGGPP
ncbi:MAG: ferredoxin reductase [Aldersonia sp.]|nr:ferredoxin reductase [Aldersonia sp.]